MKSRLIYPILLAAAAVALPSCDDGASGDTPAASSENAAAEQAPAQTEQPADSQQQDTPAATEPAQTEDPADAEQPAAQPSAEEVSGVVAPLLADFPMLEASQVEVAVEEQPDGSLLVTATTTLTAKEDLARLVPMAEYMDGVRQGINETANKAMQPDSVYLLQIGAAPSDISDSQRAAKPLPENLQAMANELKDLSGEQGGIIAVPAGSTAATVTTTMTATRNGDAWQFSNVQLNREPLDTLQGSVPASELPEGTKMITEEFEQEVQAKVAAFNEAAEAYILTREETARAILTERRALAAEALAQSEAAARAKAENAELCSRLMAEGTTYTGEWKRGSRFGTIAIFVRKAARFEDCIQFVGTLYDPKLPAASMDIYGRCEFAPDANGDITIDIEIYEGQYDPDKATAEVFDSRDGTLHLTLSADGKLRGTMGCLSWPKDSDKFFTISLTPASQNNSGKNK